jgi:hypothetical protein
MVFEHEANGRFEGKAVAIRCARRVSNACEGGKSDLPRRARHYKLFESEIREAERCVGVPKRFGTKEEEGCQIV